MVFMTGLVGSIITTPTAEAACSYNGYLNSGGNCAVSWVNATPYQFQFQNQNQYQYAPVGNIQYLQNYILQLQALIRQLEQLQAGSGWYPSTPSGVSAVDVRTNSATDVRDDRATLRGEVDFNNQDEATVYFQWGTTAASLRTETPQVVLDEDDDNEDFSVTITDLDDNRAYYYRAVAEDERGRRDYGAVLSFRTDDDDWDDDDDEDYLEVTTYSAQDIRDDEAELRGMVEMNDFDDGIVFFVYGEDEDLIDDVEDDYDRYSEVEEEGDDLQKVLIDTSLDFDRTYYETVVDLDDDTRIYYNLCVEFDDEDGDERLVCGTPRSFTTLD